MPLIQLVATGGTIASRSTAALALPDPLAAPRVRLEADTTKEVRA
jgi:L-asparaginase/Glu-tRNA(Gln) amidotransferase subunit D